MEHQKLLELIETEISENLKRKQGNVSINQLINSYNPEEKHRPILKQYATNIKTSYLENKEKNFPIMIGSNILGVITGGLIGAGIGAFASTFLEGANTQTYTSAGWIIGGVTEVLLPIPTFLYAKCMGYSKRNEKEIELYKEKALSQLEQL